MLSTSRFLLKHGAALRRNYASASKLVETSRNEKTGISIISMCRAPVNSLNLELLVELRKSFEEACKDGSKGVILTSSLPTTFSAGLDIMEIYKPDKQRATEFWRSLQDTWLTLYGLQIPTVAAINGSSPAGGCLLSIACEYRVFLEGKHTIGLNETQLGIIAPKWFKDNYIATIGYRQAELALMRGTLFTPEEALKIGLVDELATNKDDLMAKSEKYIASYAKIPSRVRQIAKLDLRSEMISGLQKNRDEDVTKFLTFIDAPQVQAGLELYLKSLKAKRQ